MYYTLDSTLRFSTFEKKVCTFLFRFSFVVFEKKVCTFLSTFQNLKVKKIFCTFLLQLQNLKVKKNPTKKYFKKHRLNAINTLFSTLKTEKFRFTSIFHGFKKYFPKTQRLKLLAQNLAVIKYNALSYHFRCFGCGLVCVALNDSGCYLCAIGLRVGRFY